MYCAHRDLHVLTHSFPTRRSFDLDARRVLQNPRAECREDCPHAELVELTHDIFGALRMGELKAEDHAVLADAGEPVGVVGLHRSQSLDRKSTRLNSSHSCASRMPSYA